MPLAICATPIGNLDDVTLRVLAELRDADVLLCEDTRRTRILLERHDIAHGGRLLSYHEHNEARRVVEVLPRLEAGERVALVSDAGLPAVSDPGGRLVDAALQAGVAVTVLPGPSAVETALVASGLAGEGYRFLGFLPRRAGELRAVWQELAHSNIPAVGFESPRRLSASLRSLAEVDPDRTVAVCRELTKRFEEVVRGTAEELAARFAEAPKGEVTLVVGPGSGAAGGFDADRAAAAVDALAELVALGVRRGRAAAIVSQLTGVPRNVLYSSSRSRN